MLAVSQASRPVLPVCPLPANAANAAPVAVAVAPAGRDFIAQASQWGSQWVLPPRPNAHRPAHPVGLMSGAVMAMLFLARGADAAVWGRQASGAPLQSTTVFEVTTETIPASTITTTIVSTGFTVITPAPEVPPITAPFTETITETLTSSAFVTTETVPVVELISPTTVTDTVTSTTTDTVTSTTTDTVTSATTVIRATTDTVTSVTTDTATKTATVTHTVVVGAASGRRALLGATGALAAVVGAALLLA